MKIINSVLVVLLFFTNKALADDPVRIGATLPLSGNVASYGNLIKGGIELAAEDLKKEGIESKLFFEDTPLAGAQVLTSLRKLSDVDHIDGIAGNFSNAAMATMAPTIEKEMLPSFHTSAVDPEILNSPNYVLSTNIRIKDEAAAMASYVFKTLGIRRVAVLSIQTNFGQAYRNFFIDKFRQFDGEVVADESFQLSDTDYKSQLLKISQSKPQAIYAACFGPFLGRSIKQARTLRIQYPFFSVYESEDASVLTSAGKAADGLRYFVTATSESSDSFAAFRARYLARYKVEPGTFGANAYDATILLGRAVSTCKKDRVCVLKELYKTADFDGVSGSFSIEPDGATTKAFVLREVKGGKFVDSNL